MKRVVLIVMLMCVSFVLRAQYDNFYYANGVSTINLDNIPSGIYFYTVRSGDDVMTGKLVVE